MGVEQQDDHHADSELLNSIPEQRPRKIKTPVDNGLIGTRVTSTNALSLASLLDESVELHHNINSSHLNLQML